MNCTRLPGPDPPAGISVSGSTSMERSFAEAGRYGFKRARWRGTERIWIQDFLIAAVQNIRLLVTYGKLKPAAAGKMGMAEGERVNVLFLFARFFGLVPV